MSRYLRRLRILLFGCPICGRGYRGIDGRWYRHMSFCRWSR